jgi:hypothetical protein
LARHIDEEDDVLDFGDIGGVYDSSAAASENTDALVAYLSTRANEAVALKFRGPKTYNAKREPAPVYLDLSSGSIDITVGGAGNITNLVFEGPSKIYGVNADAATTPLFEITRTAGQMPVIVLKNMVFESDGSVLKIINGGSGISLENIKIDDFTGSGVIDHDDWTDIDAETFSYGLYIDNADGVRISSLQIENGSGHGVVASRLHAGDVQGRIRQCDGAGWKLQQCNATRGLFWSESNKGFGVHVRDTGNDRYASGASVASYGAPNDWQMWLEGNNGRGTPYTSSGYTFSQMKLDNCSRIRATGYLGWRHNHVRLGRFDRVRNVLLEEVRTDVSADPDIELVTGNTVSGDLVLPADGFGDANITNWDTVWTDAADRPSAAKVGVAGVDERIRVTWPAGCFDATDVQVTAYWRPFYDIALVSPATFYFEAEVEDVTGDLSSYCVAREAASNRQLPICGVFEIAPIAGALTGFSLWDTQTRQFSGSIDVDDVRADISPCFNAWTSGMQDQEGNASQSAEHQLDIHQWRLWRIV